MSFDEKTVTRIIQPVTTAVLISLAEGRKEAEEGLGSAASVWMKCMLCMSLLICVAAAIFQIKPLKGGSKEGKRKEKEEKKRRSVVKMATEDEVKMMIAEKARSVDTKLPCEPTEKMKRRKGSFKQRRYAEGSCET